jgi:crotonobetainyl-CoA:carnitine CoA-transferase CaiB-like acyl-CoA transferase
MNQRLIYVSMSGYGHDGPRRNWTSMNMNLQGYSGLMTVSGAEGDPPTAISNSWNDYIGGLHAGFAILQAFEERRQSGKGRRIDLSQFECSVAMIGSLLLRSAIDGTVPTRLGNRSDQYAPQGVYPCAGTDDWCAICVENENQWQALKALIGQKDWGNDPRFESVDERIRCHDEIDNAISLWTRQYSNKEVELRLLAAGISAARVRRINEVLDPVNSSAVYARMPERRVGAMLTTKLPFTLSSVDLPEPYSAPRLGEHGLDVLREWLNGSEAEIDELKRREVLQ